MLAAAQFIGRATSQRRAASERVGDSGTLTSSSPEDTIFFRNLRGFPMLVRQILPAWIGVSAILALSCGSAAPEVMAALERDPGAIDKPALADAVAADAPVAKSVDNPLGAIPLEALTATRERPLFSATRRPPPTSGAPMPVQSAPPQAPVPVASEPQGPPLTLVGTIVGGERPVAILLNKLTRAVSTTHEGDDALGWRVTAVSTRSAIVEKDGISATLQLPKPGDPVEAAPPSP